jgi:hypothetical protein
MNHLVTLNIGSDVIHPNSRASFLAAARRWGAQYIEITTPLAPEHGYHGAWAEKLFLDLHLPDGRFIYLDGDTVIRHDAPSPFEIVPPGTWGWTRNNIASHRTTAGQVKDVFGKWTQKLLNHGVFNITEIDTDHDYCNSGLLVFDLPRHRIVWERAREIVGAVGFDEKQWIIADQGPLCAAVHITETPVLHLPGYMHHFGDTLWYGWTPAMHSFIYHACGPVDKAILCGKTVWDELGPDRLYKGRTRWRTGKPVALHDGAEVPMLIREFSRPWRGLVVEVGVYMGGTTWYGAQAARDSFSRYVCVDHWRGADDLAVDDDIYEAFQANLRDANLTDTVEIKRMSSLAAAAEFADESIDLIFIDGDHTHEGCKADILAWLPKLKEGAVMLGHDHSQRHFPGVVRAVKEIFGKPDEVSPGEYAIWKVTKDQHRPHGGW